MLRLDALLGTHHADRFTEPDGLWDEWVMGVGRLGYPSPPPSFAAGRTSHATSPTAGPGRSHSCLTAVT
ncbi:DUF6000 family protein [Streptomyces olivaceoviridis]